MYSPDSIYFFGRTTFANFFVKGTKFVLKQWEQIETFYLLLRPSMVGLNTRLIVRK